MLPRESNSTSEHRLSSPAHLALVQDGFFLLCSDVALPPFPLPFLIRLCSCLLMSVTLLDL